MNVGAYTAKALEAIMKDYIPEDENAKETAFKVIAIHPDSSGTISCMNCGYSDHVRGERKTALKAHSLKCKNCGATFTKLIKQEE